MLHAVDDSQMRNRRSPFANAGAAHLTVFRDCAGFKTAATADGSVVTAQRSHGRD